MTHNSQEEGTALADVLFGDYDPGGRLVTTWPMSLDQLPAMMDYDIRHGHTYMYFKGTPLYPFGYGLTYTSFEYSNLMTSSNSIAGDSQIAVSLNVRNAGSRVGDEVVQMYVAHTGSKVARPAEELKGFQRITLRPGEKTTVQFALKGSDLLYWNVQKGAWDLESDQVSIMIGASSADLRLKKAVSID